MMRRRLAILEFAFVIVATAMVAYGQEAATSEENRSSTRPPNIVLINADDLGWKDVGFQGTDYYETPCIDRLAQEGMIFPHAYANAGNCAPSRACLMTGYYTPCHGVYAVGDTNRGPAERMLLTPVPNELPLKSRFVTMAEALKQLGYSTGQFGKWHLGNGATGTGPRDQGFDVSMDENHGGTGAVEDPKGVDAITNAAIEFVNQHKESPFFCYVAHHAIHTPLQTREETLSRFRAKPRGEQHSSPLYAACLFELDTAVGRLVDEIDRLGLSENTIIVFMSDNGATPQSSQEPLRGAKGAYYEAGIRIPFIVRWPATVEAGSACKEPIAQTDLLPTFLALAGGDPLTFSYEDVPLDGVSLVPLIESRGLESERSIYWHFPGYLDNPVPRGRDSVLRTAPVSVVRRGDWKLLLYHEEWLLEGGRAELASNNAVELYDLQNDPGEHENLAGSQATMRDELLDDLLAWMERSNASMASVKPSESRE